MKIVFAGGGTGGHLTPIIAIAREIRKIYPRENIQLFYLGPKDDFGSILLSQEGIKVKNIFSGKIRRYFTPKALFLNIIDILFKIPFSILQSFFSLFFLAPDLIFSKGGYGSLPIVAAGRLLLIPVFLHESDIVPGKTNRFASRFAREIFVSFPETEYFPLKKMVVAGNPIRKEILKESKEKAKEFFEIKSEKPVILVLGGSQGARRINDKILEILPQLLENFEVILQCGEKNFRQIRAEARVMIGGKLEKSFHLFPFLKEPEIGLAFSIADLVVSRAGSATIFEIAGFGKPSILIPLPESAQNHQVKNAYAFAESGGCQVIEEANFTSYFFLERLKYFFSHPEELQKMAKLAKEFSRPEAGKIIANYLIDYLTKPK